MKRVLLHFEFTILPILLMFGLCFAGVEENNNFDLNNEIIRAELDQKGLISIENLNLHKKIILQSDKFSLSLNNEVISSDSLLLSDIRDSAEKIIYTYKSDAYIIGVEYELKPGWEFISKQIFINPTINKDFKINKIEVINSEISENPVSEYIPKTKRPEFGLLEYGAFLRFEDATGMFVLVQNPFLNYNREGKSLSIMYDPDMDWKSDYGPFVSDRGCIGLYKLSGQRVSANLVPEWKWTEGIIPVTDQEQDWAEVNAFTECVEAFILPHTEKSLNMHVGWCDNDYQIDIASEEGREEYKRIIDQAKDIGMDYILFAPTNSELGSRKETMDDWNWENLLWLGLGIKIRKGEWNPEKDPLPASVQEMVDYAASKNIKLVAYMYPVMPFEGNPKWIVEGTKYHRKKRNASMGVREFQDFLIKKLSEFYEKTGIGGYAYDYTFLWYEGSSRYTQWYGWKRMKETLRKKYPEIVIDGRQLDMLYGPWIWLSGSYPHPTAADEQPESFNPFPDLHFDRVSGNRQRFTAYRYRVNDYCPAEIMPGFITHQTSRKEGDTPLTKDSKGSPDRPRLRMDNFRVRDWDYLGWKYSLFSSIATGGLNNIVSMIPARDQEEFDHFSEEDKSFFRKWIKWTDQNRKYLLNTRFIIGQPAIGRIDGTSAISDNKGYIFLFNPNARQMPAKFFINQTIGLDQQSSYVIREIFPEQNKNIGNPTNGIWQFDDLFNIKMDGASVKVLEILPASEMKNEAVLFNLQGTVELKGNELLINDVKAETGSIVNAVVLLSEEIKIKNVRINDQNVNFIQNNNTIQFNIGFSGSYFSQMQQIGAYQANFSEGTIEENITIPGRIFDQLKERKKQWPINWTNRDYKTPWLAPERLLLFIQIAEPQEDMNVKLLINGQPAELQKAYTSIRRHPRCFVGWYTDISDLKPDVKHNFKLALPQLRPGQFQGLFLENIETEYTTDIVQ